MINLEHEFLPDLDKDKVESIITALQHGMNNCKMISIDDRKNQLDALLRMLTENKTEIIHALTSDFKSITDAEIEFRMIVTEGRYIINNFEYWSRPTYVSKGLIYKTDTCKIQPQPHGIVLIISAWNFPLITLLEPFFGALAAGNHVLLKPSEISVNIAKCIVNLVTKYMNPSVVQIALASPENVNLLFEHRFDYIFYTGSSRVGKIIYQKAAQNLTPVTLEMGGTNPCIVMNDVDLEHSARRIAWGKFMNAGQICASPDYILCHESIIDKFIEAFKKAIESFFGAEDSISNSSDYSRIVNHGHFKRLCKLIQDNESLIVYPQSPIPNPSTRFIPPIIFYPVTQNSTLMQDEIFGPLIPIMKIQNIDEAISIVKNRPNSLALYLFTTNSSNIEKVIKQTRSGGVCVNDTISHTLVNALPFGGIGDSGIGRYHGKYTFDTFSHNKSIMIRGYWTEVFNKMCRYAPMSPFKWNILDMLVFNIPNSLKQNFFSRWFSK